MTLTSCNLDEIEAMADTLPSIRTILESSGLPYEVWDCDPDAADTAAFCERYDVSPANSANTILVRSKTGELRFAVCVLLATHRLDVNQVVRKKLGVRKVSFASADETRDLTGMEIGGVTPIGLATELPIWVDQAVTECEFVILGGGNRSSKLKVDPKLFFQLPGVEVVPSLARAA